MVLIETSDVIIIENLAEHCGDYAMSWIPTPLAFCKKKVDSEETKVMAHKNLAHEMEIAE